MALLLDAVAAVSLLHSGNMGFKQSSFRHITRVSQRTAPDAWARPLVSWHAAVPFTFRLQVSHQTQKPPSEFLPTELGIQQGASWRTMFRQRTSDLPGRVGMAGRRR